MDIPNHPRWLTNNFYRIQDYSKRHEVATWATRLFGMPINLKSNLLGIVSDLTGKWSILEVEINDEQYCFFWTQDADIRANFILTWK